LAVRIRLSRVGATKRPSYRVVAMDSRRPRDGRALEILGFYDPLTEPATVRIDAERLAAWVSKGALPSETVAKLIKINGSTAAPSEAPAPKPARVRKPSAKATAKATTEATTGAATGATTAAATEATTEAATEATTGATTAAATEATTEATTEAATEATTEATTEAAE
jgi:small subunit ribosomal protein S16